MAAAAEKIALTDRSLQALRPLPSGQRRTVWDALLPGLAVRVSARGKRSFYAVKRRAGETSPTWTLVGVYPITGLKEAREEARKALAALMAGDSPTERAEAKRRAAAAVEAKSQADAKRREAGTFRAVAESFIAAHLPRLRTARPVEALIRRELILEWGDRPIGEIRRRDVIALLETIVSRGRPEGGKRRPKSGGAYAARHTLAAARKLFNWALSRDEFDGLESNPAAVTFVDVLAPAEARDRVLTDSEIRLVWRAAMATPYPFGPLVRALLMTGQRLREIGSARWPEIDGDILTVPAERMKGKVAHVVPLTDRMRDLLDALPRFASGSHLFSTTAGTRPFSGFSKAKERLDRKVAEIVARDRAQLVADGATEAEAAARVRGVAHWTLHDLRRTMRTGMAAAGVVVFIGELVIAHCQVGVHAIYDQHSYDAEKREALERWEARLFNIIAPEPTAPNVVAMPARVRA